jgi:hypothetical protein
MTLRFIVAVSGLLIAATTACAQPRSIGAPSNSFTPLHFTVEAGTRKSLTAGAVVTPLFFSANGVRAFLGRVLIEEDYKSKVGVAVLSHRYWTEEFGASPKVIGTTVKVNGELRVIVGVAPPEFVPEKAGDLWIPQGPQVLVERINDCCSGRQQARPRFPGRSYGTGAVEFDHTSH